MLTLTAEDYRKVIFDDAQTIHFPVDITVYEDENDNTRKLVTVAWLDDNGHLQFRTEALAGVIFIRKLSGGIMG